MHTPLEQKSWTVFTGNPLVETQQAEINLLGQQVVSSLEQRFWHPQPSDTVLVNGIPCYLSIAEFCSFVGAYLESVMHLRILRYNITGSTNSTFRGKIGSDSYLVLMLFNSARTASYFREELNGQFISSLSVWLVLVVWLYCRQKFVQ